MEKDQRIEEETSITESDEVANIGSENVLKSTEGNMKAVEGWSANSGAGGSIGSNDISSNIVTCKAPNLPDVLKECDEASDVFKAVPTPHGEQNEMTSPKPEDYEPFQSNNYGANKHDEGLDAKCRESSALSEDREKAETYGKKETAPTSSVEMRLYPDSKYVINELPEYIVNDQRQGPTLEKSLPFSDIMGHIDKLEAQQHPLLPVLIGEDTTMPRSVEDNVSISHVPYEHVARKISNQGEEGIKFARILEDSFQNFEGEPSTSSDIQEVEGHSKLYDNTSETLMIVKDVGIFLQGGNPSAKTPEEFLTGNDMLLAPRAFAHEQLRTHAVDTKGKLLYNVKSSVRAHIPSRQEEIYSLSTSQLRVKPHIPVKVPVRVSNHSN